MRKPQPEQHLKQVPGQNGFRLFDLNADRAMIRAFDFRANERALQSRTQRFADQKIIDAPAYVSPARAAEGTPPRVMAPALFKFPKRVHKASLDDFVKAGALLRRETVVVNVRLRVRQINLGMRDV